MVRGVSNTPLQILQLVRWENTLFLLPGEGFKKAPRVGPLEVVVMVIMVIAAYIDWFIQIFIYLSPLWLARNNRQLQRFLLSLSHKVGLISPVELSTQIKCWLLQEQGTITGLLRFGQEGM